MKKDTIITVNGQQYDTVTGLPVTDTPVAKPTTSPATPRTTSNARALHAKPARSKTLQRTAAKKGPKPTASTGSTTDVIQPRKSQSSKVQPRSAAHPQVKKFAPTGQKKPTVSQDIAPRQHPHAAAAAHKQAVKRAPVKTQSAATISSKAVKDAEIKKALATTKKPVPHKKPAHTPRRRTRVIRWSTLLIIAAIILGVVTWINLPTLSVRIAASQSFDN